jgi:endoglucanase
MTLDLDFLRELCVAHGVSGYEEPAQVVVRDRLMVTAQPVVDVLGNLTATVNGLGRPHVVVASHCDQIGLVVTEVGDDGYVFVDAVGMVDSALPRAREFVILGESGPVAAVGGCLPAHLAARGQGADRLEIHQQPLDIGARTRAEALSRIAPGDPIIPKPSFIQLASDIYAGPALDDRAGIYAIVRAAELYASGPQTARLDVLSTVCEETGKLGARGQAMTLRPDCTIVVDVEHATDQPKVDKTTGRGTCVLGAGPVLSRGSCSNKNLLALARDVAVAEGIDVQIMASPSPTYTDADELQGWPNSANLNIGIPLRYMHSPFEVCSGSDLEATANLLAALVRRVGDEFSPGYFLTLPT